MLPQPFQVRRRRIPAISLQRPAKASVRTAIGTNEKRPAFRPDVRLSMKPSSWTGPVYAGAAQNSVQEQPAERFPGLPYAPRMQAVSRPKSPNALWQAAGFRSFPTPRRPSRQDGKKLCPTSKGLSTAKGARRRGGALRVCRTASGKNGRPIREQAQGRIFPAEKGNTPAVCALPGDAPGRAAGGIAQCRYGSQKARIAPPCPQFTLSLLFKQVLCSFLLFILPHTENTAFRPCSGSRSVRPDMRSGNGRGAAPSVLKSVK